MSFDRRNTLDDDDDDDAIDSNIGMTVKAIVLDDGFWQSITEILHVAMPIIKLLRLLDSNKPVIGKVAVLWPRREFPRHHR